jgi:hypothetical protein
MAIPANRKARELAKFTEASSSAGQTAVVVVNADGTDVGVDSAPYSVDRSGALEASTISKASTGRVYKVSGRIDQSAASDEYFIQLLDSASLPADGAVVTLIAPVLVDHVTGTHSYFDIDLAPSGVASTAGIVLTVSTTEFTKTIAGSILATTVLYK